MPKNTSLDPLVYLLEQKVIPWIEQNGLQRVLVARPAPSRVGSIDLSASNVPQGMQITPRPRRGRRTSGNSRRSYGNCTILSGQWIEDRQVALRFPKLICVVRGDADIRVGDYTVHCREGHFILLPPGVAGPDGTAHLEGEECENRYCELLALSFQGGPSGVIECGVCHSQGARHFGKPGEHCSISNAQLVVYFEAMLEELLLRAEGHEKIARHMLLALLTILLREIKAGRSLQWFPPGISRDRSSQSQIDKACTYITHRISDSLTIADVARAIGMSRSQFIKMFQRETGKSFSNYLIDLRLERARTLLSNSEWSIQVVGEIVGLSAARMRELFHQRSGQSPSEYRLKARESAEPGVDIGSERPA